MDEIIFIVDHEPVAQPRQRHRVISGKSGKPFASNYTPANHPVQSYKQAVRDAASRSYRGDPLEGPLRVDYVFVMPRPKGKFWKTKPMPRYPHTSKPDRDNLEKSTGDALTGIIWKDDSQVCDGVVTKVVANGVERPHVEVRISIAKL